MKIKGALVILRMCDSVLQIVCWLSNGRPSAVIEGARLGELWRSEAVM